jgi:hypothetical protein
MLGKLVQHINTPSLLARVIEDKDDKRVLIRCLGDNREIRMPKDQLKVLG